MIHRKDLRIRDPFFLTDRENNCYYLYGTGSAEGRVHSFEGYRTFDLEHYEGPFPLFESSASFWADEDFWAPEVYQYKGRYYMFATFSGKQHKRGTQILYADSPLGHYRPLTAFPLTPADWMCLDGTFYLEDGQPWMVFCHEWVQISDGQICAMPLTEDLTAPAALPITLFSAGDSGWAQPYEDFVPAAYITDGPFLRKTSGERLILLWSSFVDGRYALGQARSLGGVAGPYEHLGPLYTEDGGHGMLFDSLDGRLLLAVHAPNVAPDERLMLIPLRDEGDQFSLA